MNQRQARQDRLVRLIAADDVQARLCMALAPRKKPYRNVARVRSHKPYRAKLCRGETLSWHRTRSAPVDFPTPAILGARVWRAGRAMSYVIVTSRKTSLPCGRGQTLAQTSFTGTAPWCAPLANQMAKHGKAIGSKHHRQTGQQYQYRWSL